MDFSTIKVIVFDFDGVIEENYEHHYQLSKIKTINLTREEHKKLFDGNIHIERAKLKDRNTNFDLMLNFNRAKEFLKIENTKRDILIKLSKNYKLGIITSGYEKYIIKYLKNNNLVDIFNFVYGFETNPSKVSKFNKVINTYKHKPSEIIFITDTLGDILEAKKLNINSIAVDYGYHEKSRLEKGKPYKIISSFQELYDLF